MNKAISGKTVLIVDDEVDLRKAIVYDFKKLSCVTYEACDGAEALEIVKKVKVDIVISDIRMPNLNGIDLLKKIRELHLSKPVVFLITGQTDITENEALNMGAYALLEKPINRKNFFQLLEEAAAIN
ncbi:MAG: response regulator [Bdellovibrionota bacterium]